VSLHHSSSQSIWKRSQYLERMTKRELTVSFFQHHVVWCYLIPGLLAAFVVLPHWAPALGILAICIERFPYKPQSHALSFVKARHLEHHVCAKNGGRCMTSIAWNLLFRTLYGRNARAGRSPIANLGYAKDTRHSPWAADRPGGQALDRPMWRR
jgi:hypothetical protein